MEIATFSALVPDGAPQSKGQSRKRQRNPLKGWKWQKPPKEKENWENCRENKPCAICYVVACSNSAGNLSDGRKKLGWVPLAQWNHKSQAVLQWEKHGNCNFFSTCPGVEHPKAQEKLENGKETHWKDGNCNFFSSLAEAAQSKGKLWKIAEKISHVPSVCM